MNAEPRQHPLLGIALVVAAADLLGLVQKAGLTRIGFVTEAPAK